MVYFRRSPIADNRKITKVKMGDIIHCWRDVMSLFSNPGRRKSYYKTEFIDDKEHRGRRGNVCACKLIVTTVYDYYISVQDLKTGDLDTLTLGDLVMMGYEPEFLGSCIEEHVIKYGAPVSLRL